MMKIGSVLFLLLVWCSPAPSSNPLHVEQGARHGDGSLQRPYGSIGEAAAVARNGDTVCIHAGVYREAVRPAHDGTAGAPIVFMARHGDSVVINGAEPITDWKLHRPHIYAAPLEFSTDEVYGSGALLTGARWPNGAGDPLHPVFAIMDDNTSNDERATNTVRDADVSIPAGFFDGARIWFTGDERWWARTGAVTGSGPGRLEIEYAPVQLWWGCLPGPNAPYYVYDCFNALDTAGEWFQDADDTLYLYSSAPPANIEASRRRLGFDLRDRSWITLRGIHFFSASVHAEDADHCIIDGCTFRYVCPRYAIADPRDREHADFVATDATPGVGVYLGGEDNVIQNSTVHGSWGDGVTLGGRTNSAINCLVSDVGYNGCMASGISPIGDGHRIERCTIRRTGRSGIRFRMTNGIITRNEIHDIGRINWDLGGVYSNDEKGSFVGGTEISYNAIHHILAHRSTGPGDYYGGKGVFLDNNSSGVLVHHNLIWALPDCNGCAGIGLNWENRAIRVYHNSIAGRAMDRFANNYTLSDVRVYNNVALDGNWIGTDTKNNVMQDKSHFVDARGGDLRLSEQSPAINAGVAIEGLFGDSRPEPDAGAIAYGADTFAYGYTPPRESPTAASVRPAAHTPRRPAPHAEILRCNGRRLSIRALESIAPWSILIVKNPRGVPVRRLARDVAATLRE